MIDMFKVIICEIYHKIIFLDFINERVMISMSIPPLDVAVEKACTKSKILKYHPLRFFTQATLAGSYIGLAVIFSFTIGESFRLTESPATTLISGMAFSLALVMIILGNADLFTGNVMYLTMSTLSRKTTWKDLLSNWLATYLGNLIGVLIITVMIVLAEIFSHASLDHFLIATAVKKSSLPGIALFFRGILCNWLICLAVWIPMYTKDYIAKMALIMFIVTAFFVSGYEHSIANMAIFAISLTMDHPETLTLAASFRNIGIVTLGNIIGGGLFVGGAYYYITQEIKQKTKIKITEKNQKAM